MSDYRFLETETADRTLWITLDNEASLNALTPTLLTELETALRGATDSHDGDGESVRAVVLSGAGRAFSAGYDFAEGVPERMDDRLTARFGHLDAIHDLPMPVIAAVDGYALAGGCNLAIACDLTLATEDSEFGYPDVRMGELPPRLVVPHVTGSLKHARELLYGGKRIDAARAREMGLVNRVLADRDALEAAVAEELEGIHKTPGSVVALLKGRLNDLQATRGYRSGPTATVDQSLFAASAGTEVAERFHEIVAEEGVNAAIDWMHTAEKE